MDIDLNEDRLVSLIKDSMSKEKIEQFKIGSSDLFPATKLEGRCKYKELNDYPGIYKWWATKEVIQDILPEGVDFKKMEISGDYYCLYVGKASGQPLRKRLAMHYNHTEGVSAIRGKIAKALNGVEQKSEEVSKYVRKLMVSTDVYELDTKSHWTDIFIETLELMEINNGYDHPFNSSQNYSKTED